MQRLEVSGAVRHIYIYMCDIRRLRVNIHELTGNVVDGEMCL
jgi:hypothetical protein